MKPSWIAIWKNLKQQFNLIDLNHSVASCRNNDYSEVRWAEAVDAAGTAANSGFRQVLHVANASWTHIHTLCQATPVCSVGNIGLLKNPERLVPRGGSIDRFNRVQWPIGLRGGDRVTQETHVAQLAFQVREGGGAGRERERERVVGEGKRAREGDRER